MTEPVSLDAALRLSVAVDQLTKPDTATLTRVDPLLDDQAGALAHADRLTSRRLRAEHEAHLEAARNTLARLVAHEQRVAAQRATTAALPCLLEQLRDAVTSTGGGGGASAGVHRSPIGLAAVELLRTIQVEVRSHGELLVDDLRAWTPGDVAAAADHAEAWVEAARTLLNPPRRWTHPGACPDCGARTATVTDDSGQLVRRPAIEFDRATARARCLRCPARWTTEGQLRQLARVLEQQQA